MKNIFQLQELRGAIWAADTALKEAENNTQEHLSETSTKIVMLHVDNLRTLVESARQEFESTLKEIKERNPIFELDFSLG